MSFNTKKLETDLATEFNKHPRYHIEAIYFMTQHITKSAPVEDIYTLISLLKAKRGTLEETMALLWECLSLMSEHDTSFKCYLNHFTGGPAYREQHPPQVGGACRQFTGPAYTPSKRIESPSDMDSRMSDSYVLCLHEHIDVQKLEDFATFGLDMKLTKATNAINGCLSTKDKFRKIFKLWSEEAPIDSMHMGGGMPSFTKRGLRNALENAKLNDAIVSLKLR